MRLPRNRLGDFGPTVSDIYAVDVREAVDVRSPLRVFDSDALTSSNDRGVTDFSSGELLELGERMQNAGAIGRGDGLNVSHTEFS